MPVGMVDPAKLRSMLAAKDPGQGPEDIRHRQAMDRPFSIGHGTGKGDRFDVHHS
jgi:hypothetical protein